MLTSQQLAKGLEHLNFMQHTIQATEDPLGLLYLVFPDLIFGVFCLFPGIGRKISNVMIETMLFTCHGGFAGLIHQSYHRNCLNLDPICFIFFEQIQPSIDVASNLFFYIVFSIINGCLPVRPQANSRMWSGARITKDPVGHQGQSKSRDYMHPNQFLSIETHDLQGLIKAHTFSIKRPWMWVAINVILQVPIIRQ